VPPDLPEYQDARSLLGFLANFASLNPRWVPPDSILREFIGESTFKY
jgi:uridine kinase